MPRSLWNGTISVGLINVPVKLYLDNGKSVVVTDADLEAVAPRRTRTIDIEAFVEVMGRTERAALGRFVMRTKEYLVAIRVRDGRLALTTMLCGDEIRPTKDIDTGGRKPPKQQLDQAVALIEALSGEWRPEDFEDCYRARLQDVVARKRRGKRISAPKPEKEPSPVPDLMASLERSLAEATGRGGDGKRDLKDLSRDELYERAQREDVPGRSSMSKEELVDALSR